MMLLRKKLANKGVGRKLSGEDRLITFLLVLQVKGLNLDFLVVSMLKMKRLSRGRGHGPSLSMAAYEYVAKSRKCQSNTIILDTFAVYRMIDVTHGLGRHVPLPSYIEA